MSEIKEMPLVDLSAKDLPAYCPNLGEACALISRASAVVTNDSGLMHVAAAAKPGAMPVSRAVRRAASYAISHANLRAMSYGSRGHLSLTT